VLLEKKLGVGPPGENCFPAFFQDIDQKIYVSNARDPGKIWLIFLAIGAMRPELEAPTYGVP
jgi:hypothetical protein